MRFIGMFGYPQHPPPQHPPPPAGAPARPVIAMVVSSLTVSSCPTGQVAGADDSLIGRDSSNCSAQSRHLYA
jgi:hypothetical protein